MDLKGISIIAIGLLIIFLWFKFTLGPLKRWNKKESARYSKTQPKYTHSERRRIRLGKIIASIICIFIFFLYVVLLEYNGIPSKTLGGAIPAMILMSILTSIYFFIMKYFTPKKPK
jgi:uncharacterized membrane protein